MLGFWKAEAGLVLLFEFYFFGFNASFKVAVAGAAGVELAFDFVVIRSGTP